MILITRPIDDAVELQQELKKKKIQTLIDPLTSFKFRNREIKFTDDHIYICASQRCVVSLTRIKNIKNIRIIGWKLFYSKRFIIIFKNNNWSTLNNHPVYCKRCRST